MSLAEIRSALLAGHDQLRALICDLEPVRRSQPGNVVYGLREACLKLKEAFFLLDGLDLPVSNLLHRVREETKSMLSQG